MDVAVWQTRKRKKNLHLQFWMLASLPHKTCAVSNKIFVGVLESYSLFTIIIFELRKYASIFLLNQSYIGRGI